ncbi:hypothetical protein H4582DRAFT_2085442 [Lactarius indigo]|nr:hypothetical protein H4582DRAFT_2085442 [Lactarius indigo]
MRKPRARPPLSRILNRDLHRRQPRQRPAPSRNNNSRRRQRQASSSGGRPGPPLASWAAELSASFAIIAEQLQNASRTMATAGAGASTDLLPRLDAVEQAQERLAVELAALRSLHAGKSRALAPNESLIVPDVVSSSVSSADLERRLADLERRLADTLNSQRLEQERLYARLFNSRATVSKMPILALPTTTGKIPPNHPNSKGEFEHLTKERYEGLLKAYDQPIPGDTAAKREGVARVSRVASGMILRVVTAVHFIDFR